MARSWGRALLVGLITVVVTAIGAVAADRYVSAAISINIEQDLTERIAAVRRQIAAGEETLAAAQPFIRVLVGAGVRISSPNAENVSIDRTWVDDGKIHDLDVDGETYAVVTQRATVDGLIATVTVGRPKSDGTRGSAALRRALALLTVLAGLAATVATRIVGGGGRSLHAAAGRSDRPRQGRRSASPATSEPDEIDYHAGGPPPVLPRPHGPLVRSDPTPTPPPPPLFGDPPV